MGKGKLAWAQATWYCEALTVALTVVYCGIVAHDVSLPPGSKASARFSSESWFQRGFCESREPFPFNSHTMCFVVDLILGSALTFANYRRLSRVPAEAGEGLRPALQLALAVSVFNVMHGFGHGFIRALGGMDADMLDTLRPANAPVHVTLGCFLGLSSFLAIGPFIGYMHGMSGAACLAIHLPAMLCFMQFVPLQFAFGSVQLVLNSWVCLPRLALVGWPAKEAHWSPDFFLATEAQIAARLENGWLVVSAGLLLLMPVVFAEMLACDSFLHSLSGHFLYDFSTLLMSAVYSVSIWRQCDGLTSHDILDTSPKAKSS